MPVKTTLIILEFIIESIGIDKKWDEYTKFIIDNELINKTIIRNEGYLKSVKND